MSKTLVIVNPRAGGGYASRVWNDVRSAVEQTFGAVEVAITPTAQAVYDAVEEAVNDSVERVLSIGGDGTNHVVINAIMHAQIHHPAHAFVYGMLPAGTGRDWARGVGMPLNPRDALRHIARKEPRPIDVGVARFDDTTEYFLNISSVGISNDIVQRVEDAEPRRPWTYLKAVVAGILRYEPEPVTIHVDGELWYEGKIYVVAIANGTTFGQGMIIAPQARFDDGLLDIVLIDDLKRVELLLALRTVFNATHLSNPHVHATRGERIHITSDGRALGMDLDGEPARGRNIIYTVQHQAVKALV